MSRPLVSVVTPVLNRASMIRTCLRSVASQTYPSIEHIVVDGGSSDGTVDILREFKTDRSFRWSSEPDDGMYAAINKGLGVAEGEVICYLNSDDMYLPWTVDTAVDRLRRGADLVFGDLVSLRVDTKPSSLYIQFYPDFDLRYYTHVAVIGQPTVFWRRSLIDAVGYFDTTYRLIGDCEYWLRAGVAGARFEHVDEVLAVQVEHSGTLRLTHRDQLVDEFARLRSHYGDFARPPLSPHLQQLKKGLMWRKSLLQFQWALRQRNPHRWPRFVGFLRRQSIGTDELAFLAMMLPASLRPSRAGWGSPREFEHGLMQEIGAR